MNDAVFVAGIAMWASVITMVVLGLAGGAIMYICERIASKSRSDAH